MRTPALVTVEVEPTGDEAELTPFRLQFDARLIDGRYQVHQATLTQVDGGQSVTATSLSAIRWPELMRRALAGLVYGFITYTLVRGGETARKAAQVCCAAELVGVLTVGTWTLVEPSAFADATVWSDYGMGYLFIPVLLGVGTLLAWSLF